VDRQVKIRGNRIELDEIAIALSSHLGVDFAEARVDSSTNGEKQLVGYILPKNDGPAPRADDLRIHLLQSLPDYMVPTVFVRLRQLPLSANGKFDFRLLPQPTNENLLESSLTRRLGTPIEEKVLAIMRDLLGHDDIAAEDNFFLAGAIPF
jgi:arthrofactin-type cyclic lipopeptide synthetase B